MAHIDIVEQTFRDGQQSLWGMRLRGGMLERVARQMDEAGFRAIEVTGSSLMECSVRYSHEDPWDALDLWRKWMPRSELRAPVCQNRIGTFGMTPDSMMDLYVRTLSKHGIDQFWIYDCLYNMEQMQRLSKTIDAAGAKAMGAIMFGISPVHTDDWFAARVAEMASWPTISGIYVEDAPGILAPERARTLVPALLKAAGDKPIEFHFHNTTGMGALNYVIAMESGADCLHTCARSMANGPSLPSTEQTLENIKWMGHSHSIDEAVLPLISDHCERIALQEGWDTGVPNEYSAFAYRHHLPGGMTGTLKKQLAQYGMQHRLEEVLEETVRVREEMGHPISATPFSQLIGIQSVLNVVTGERWSTVPEEVVLYLYEQYGVPPAPVSEEIKDRVFETEQGRRLRNWQRPQPSIAEMREQYGGAKVSDEELILRYLVPEEDLTAARAAGPLKTSYDYQDDAAVQDLLDHMNTLTRPKHVRIKRPDGEVTLRLN